MTSRTGPLPFRAVAALGLLLWLWVAGPGRPIQAQAQASESGWLDTPIAVEAPPEADAAVAARLEDIFGRLPGLEGVTAAVDGGVVSLGGTVANEGQAERALQTARRVEGIVAVDDRITRTLDVGDNVGRLNTEVAEMGEAVLQALPLLVVALLAWVGIYLLGRFLAARLVSTGVIPGKRALNPFLSQTVGLIFRTVFFLIGLVVALNLVGASGLVATILGGAGVLGIAFGFAIRDTLENYISSVLLSVRQPFRMGDHVVIDGTQEGRVARLTSRATILVTLDGNQLRIPNADVFKARILNYTTNPTRRFSFRLGVDSADDPTAAIAVGVKALCAQSFVLGDPAPSATIVEVGDSSIIIEYRAWVDQTATDFGQARSTVIQAVKSRLETGGFSLPEPIYRLRIDGLDAGALPRMAPSHKEVSDKTSLQKTSPQKTSAQKASPDKPAPTPPPSDPNVAAHAPATQGPLVAEAAKPNLLDAAAATE